MPSSPERKVFAVILAAGASRRFGATKQLAELDGRTLVRRALDTAVAVTGVRTVLVLGHEWERVAESCKAQPGFFIVNEDYGDGIGSSIACAARALSGTADGILVMLADQAAVPADHLRSMLQAWSGDTDEIVVTKFDGTRGPPVLLPSATFPQLVKLLGDTGARRLFADSRFRCREIECPEAAIDVDTPADLRSL